MRLGDGQFLDAQVAELDVVVVAEEAEMAALAQQAGVFLERLAVGHVVEVGVHDDLAVEGHADVTASAVNLLFIPFADGAERAALGGGDEIDGAVELRVLELGVFLRGVVEDLHLHAGVGEAAGGEGRADGDAVVGAGLQLELKAVDEVAVLAFGEQVAAAALGAKRTPSFTP